MPRVWCLVLRKGLESCICGTFVVDHGLWIVLRVWLVLWIGLVPTMVNTRFIVIF